jgi:hypothetical protein
MYRGERGEHGDRRNVPHPWVERLATNHKVGSFREETEETVYARGGPFESLLLCSCLLVLCEQRLEVLNGGQNYNQ